MQIVKKNENYKKIKIKDLFFLEEEFSFLDLNKIYSDCRDDKNFKILK